MKINWSRGAVRQLAAACDSVAIENIEAANKLQVRILEHVQQLATYPTSGRQGRVRNTRELAIVGTPYIIAYRIRPEGIQVLAVLHAKRRWPSSF